MYVTLTFNHLPPVTITLAEWVEIGKLKGYCKTNKIKLNQVNQIEYNNEHGITDNK